MITRRDFVASIEWTIEREGLARRLCVNAAGRQITFDKSYIRDLYRCPLHSLLFDYLRGISFEIQRNTDRRGLSIENQLEMGEARRFVRYDY